MDVILATTAAAVRVSRLESLKWRQGNLGTSPLLDFSHPYLSCHPARDPAASCSPRFSFTQLYSRQPRVKQRLNGSRRAHLPAVRDDRARPGLRLDAVPETERQASQTSWPTSAALQVCVSVFKCMNGGNQSAVLTTCSLFSKSC